MAGRILLHTCIRIHQDDGQTIRNCACQARLTWAQADRYVRDGAAEWKCFRSWTGEIKTDSRSVVAGPALIAIRGLSAQVGEPLALAVQSEHYRKIYGWGRAMLAQIHRRP